SLCSRARPRALGTNAIVSPAAERRMPAPMTLAVTNVPAAIEAFAAPRPATSTMTRAPSDTRSSRYTVLSTPTSTALTTNTAPAADRMTGAATEAPAAALAPAATDATGKADSALSAETSLCERAGAAAARPSTRVAAMKCVFMIELLVIGESCGGNGGPLCHRALHLRFAKVGLVRIAQRLGQRESTGDQVQPAHAQEGL